MTKFVPTEESTYVVLGCKSWNKRTFDDRLRGLPGKWVYWGSPAELSAPRLREIAPRYVFVLHWSWKVPAEIYENFECICFHMTDVPFGRGGSPLQNLILRGLKETRLSALRMVGEFDAGPVYLKEPMSLEGSAESIYLRADDLAARMIERLVSAKLEPKPQQGSVVTFRRRRPKDSEIEDLLSIDLLYDFIRMLDAEGYPRAFFSRAGFRFEFSHAVFSERVIEANVRITELPAGKESQ